MEGDGGSAEGGEPIPRLKIFSARLLAAGFFKHRWKVVRLVSGFLFFNGPPATVTPVAEGGGCSWRQTKSRSTCHLIPTPLARGLSHAPLPFVRRRSGSRDINFLLLSFYRVLSQSLVQRLKRLMILPPILYPLIIYQSRIHYNSIIEFIGCYVLPDSTTTRFGLGRGGISSKAREFINAESSSTSPPSPVHRGARVKDKREADIDVED